MINNMQEDKVIFTFGVNTACSNINMTYEEVQEEENNGEEQSTTNQNAEEVTVVYSCEAVQMNKLAFAIAVTFALIACTNIPAIAEQGNTAKQVNTKC